jgi:hypothetical protein
MSSSSNISTAEVKNYLDELRDSGVTNMFGAAPYLVEDFNMSKAEARKALSEWMENF